MTVTDARHLVDYTLPSALLPQAHVILSRLERSTGALFLGQRADRDVADVMVAKGILHKDATGAYRLGTAPQAVLL